MHGRTSTPVSAPMKYECREWTTGPSTKDGVQCQLCSCKSVRLSAICPPRLTNLVATGGALLNLRQFSSLRTKKLRMTPGALASTGGQVVAEIGTVDRHSLGCLVPISASACVVGPSQWLHLSGPAQGSTCRPVVTPLRYVLCRQNWATSVIDSNTNASPLAGLLDDALLVNDVNWIPSSHLRMPADDIPLRKAPCAAGHGRAQWVAIAAQACLHCPVFRNQTHQRQMTASPSPLPATQPPRSDAASRPTR